MTNNNSQHTKLQKKIRAKLILAGVQLKDIANDLKVTRPSVSRTIAGLMASERIRQEIAIRIGQPVRKLWPVRRRRGSHI